MVSCPHCQQPVLEMALKCRHCGGTLDEHTMCLGEEALLAEIAQMRAEAAGKQSSARRQAMLSKVLLVVGGVVAVGGVFVAALPVRVGTVLGGLLVLGVGWWLRRPKA